MLAKSARATHPVLVMQAESLGAVAVVRSLGRAGYPVVAAASNPSALGLFSKFASAAEVCPKYASPEFMPWLKSAVSRHRLECIVPSEGFLLAARSQFSSLHHLLPFGGEERTTFSGLSKFDLLSRLASSHEPQLQGHLPPTALVNDLHHPPGLEALQALGMPVYLKVDGSYSTAGENGFVEKLGSAEAARHRVSELANRFTRALLQGHVGGKGVGAFFLLQKGEVLAEFMHRRLHEVPHTGGASSLRESWFHEAIRDDALAKLRAMSWEGVAMMEYRWDESTGDFWFLEMNGRFWGSLHLPIYAGIDFPTLLMDSFFGLPVEVQRSYPLGLRCRNTFPGEMQHVLSKLRDPGVPRGERARAILEFASLSIDPAVRSDLLFPGDRSLYFRGMLDTARSMIRVAGSKRGTPDFEPSSLKPAEDSLAAAHPLPRPGGQRCDKRSISADRSHRGF